MNMQVVDWAEHYKAVRSRITKVQPPVPARERLGVTLYEQPIGPQLWRYEPTERDWLILDSFKPSAPTFKSIRDAILEREGVSVEAFQGRRRSADLVRVRHEIWWEVSRQTKLSLPQIGRLSNRDHTVVLHGIRCHQERVSGQKCPELEVKRERTKALYGVRKDVWAEARRKRKAQKIRLVTP